MGLVSCPVCNVKVKAENLPNHIKKVHPGSDVRVKPVGRKMRNSSREGGSRRIVYAVSAAIILVVGSLLVYSMISSPGTPEI
ncbi:MAG: hypothetical protein V3V98_01465, partial [Thermoplasmata archaeon]